MEVAVRPLPVYHAFAGAAIRVTAQLWNPSESQRKLIGGH